MYHVMLFLHTCLYHNVWSNFTSFRVGILLWNQTIIRYVKSHSWYPYQVWNGTVSHYLKRKRGICGGSKQQILGDINPIHVDTTCRSWTILGFEPWHRKEKLDLQKFNPGDLVISLFFSISHSLPKFEIRQPSSALELANLATWHRTQREDSMVKPPQSEGLGKDTIGTLQHLGTKNNIKNIKNIKVRI